MCRNAWFLKSCSEHTIYIIYRVAYNGWDCKDNLKLNLNIQPYCAQWRHIQCKYVRPELGTLVLCISRSMLDLLVINLFFNRTQSGVQDSFGQRLKGTLIILILKLKVTRVDIEIKRWVSNTKASSSVHNIWKNFWCEIFSIIQMFGSTCQTRRFCIVGRPWQTVTNKPSLNN